MKTIEERAKEYAMYDTGIDKAEYNAYVAGATDQRKIDIDKAICWLQTQNLTRGRTGFINDFKKAMQNE